MQLHRTAGKPDWEAIDVAERNGWQHWAMRSHGILTPGNVITVTGFIGVVYGLVLLADKSYGAGLLVLAAGRACDLLDGLAADYTGTKSPLGEKMDATFDKLSTGLSLIVLVVIGIVPLWIALLLAVQQAAAIVFALVALKRGTALHPSRTGKLGMAGIWLGLLLIVSLQALHIRHLHVVVWAVYAFFLASLLLSTAAVISYRDQLAPQRRTR